MASQNGLDAQATPVVNFEITRDGSIAILTFVREERLNALDHRTMQELIDAFDELGRDESVSVIVMTGLGKAFVAGADINGYLDIELLDYVNFQRLGRRMYDAVETCPKPVIAAVNGWALGGGFELVLVADIVIASERAKLGLPECKLGLLPGGGGTQRLPRLVGRNKAKELLMTGEPITAIEGGRLGIVNKVVPPEELMDAALAMARTIAERAPQAVRMAKQLVNDGIEAPLDTAITMETGMTATLLDTQDAREGIGAFFEKRAPVFMGR
jgi:enoyl-CoA hydratase